MNGDPPEPSQPELSLTALAQSFDAGAPRAALPPEPEPGRTRRWALLHRDAEAEAWVIAWPVGTGLGLHDHAGSRAGVHVLAGELRERYLSDGELVVRWWNRGDSFDLPHDHVHEVVNVSDDEAVSIHVYSPPLGDVRFRADDRLGSVLLDEAAPF